MARASGRSSRDPDESLRDVRAGNQGRGVQTRRAGNTGMYIHIFVESPLSFRPKLCILDEEIVDDHRAIALAFRIMRKAEESHDRARWNIEETRERNQIAR